MNKTGVLVVSLDFELLWGVFDKVDWREKKDYFQNTRKVVPEILRLFENFGISCTWATVGMLLNEDWDEWNSNIPEVLPEYEQKKLSPYVYGKRIQRKETEKICFAPKLISQIKETPGQEIGTHTYSHYYCLEKGQSGQSFRADLKMALKLAKNLGVELNSLVFPRNQYNREYLEICKEEGLKTVRLNPETWYWKNTQQESLQQKVFRTSDAYIGWKNKSYGDIEQLIPGVWGQKASRFLRPHSGKKLFDSMRLQRIRSEMSKAAKHNEIYHLWWHPHNFGAHPSDNLKDLRYLLEHFRSCQEKFGFVSRTMGQIVNE